MRNGIILSVLVVLGVAPCSWAQIDFSRTQVHAYGSWGYGETDGNQYQLGTDQGSYEQASFGINLTATPTQRLMLTGQVLWLESETSSEDLSTELDFLFAEWRFSDAFGLRIGKVKHPFGIYSEVYRTGTVRPFLELPQGLYGSQGFVSRSYMGVGGAGSYRLQGDWELQYDVYVGAIDTPVDSWFFDQQGPEQEQGPSGGQVFEYRDVIGSRVVALTPVNGLSFGGSFYRGTWSPGGAENSGITSIAENARVWGVQLEYLGAAWTVRGEYAQQSVDTDFLNTVDAAYGELAYKPGEHWQVAARYDWSSADMEMGQGPAPGEDPFAPAPDPLGGLQLFDHQDIAVALNYWFNSSMVVKIEYHDVSGNRIAGPGAQEASIALSDGILKSDTRLFQLGVQFSF